jgi:PncC family amidohydrolase
MLNKLLKQLHKKLLKNNQTIATAESCTAGLLASLLTETSGSSQYFLLGTITYSNKAKIKILGVPAKIITKHGAVSSQVAILMAENIRKKINSSIGLSITGIAGPAGATYEKPVGTIYICLSTKNKNSCQKFLFSGSRQEIRKKSAFQALHLLLKNL